MAHTHDLSVKRKAGFPLKNLRASRFTLSMPKTFQLIAGIQSLIRIESPAPPRSEQKMGMMEFKSDLHVRIK